MHPCISYSTLAEKASKGLTFTFIVTFKPTLSCSSKLTRKYTVRHMPSACHLELSDNGFRIHHYDVRVSKNGRNALG